MSVYADTQALENLKNQITYSMLRLGASTAGGMSLIPGQGTKTPQNTWCGQKNPPNKKKALHTAQVPTKWSWVLFSLKQTEPPVKT